VLLDAGVEIIVAFVWQISSIPLLIDRDRRSVARVADMSGQSTF